MASQTSELNNAGNFIFKNDDDVKSLGERAALLAKELKYDSAGVLFAKYTNAAIDAVNAFKTEFEKLGGKVLISEGFGKDESDFKKYLLKIKNKKPNVIFVNGLPNDNGLILKQFGELNLHQAIIGNATMEDPQIVEIAKNYAEGVIFPTFQGIVSENYIQKVKAKTGKSPLRWSVEAYDGFKIIASAVSNIKGEVNSENLRIELSKIKVYNGESGGNYF